MIGALDRTLGRITMYRLVLMALAALFVVALAHSFAGAVFSTPTELLATAAVALGVTALLSAVLARLVGTRAHLESSLITGFLLVFLLFPTAEPAGLAVVSLVAAVAAASKFVLVRRGRHLFNPAAVAVLIVGLVQAVLVAMTGSGPLTSATWWVASGALWPYVLVASLVVVARVRRWGVFVVFVLVASVVSVLSSLSNGLALSAAVTSVVTAYPYVFAGAFMLTEPLTLAPRLRQQLAIAAVAALLTAVPFHVGPITASPELGIVVGNALAFTLGQRRAVSLELRGSREVSSGIREFRFAPAAPVRFRSGQYLELQVPHRADRRGTRRTFSIASAPDAGELTLAMRLPERASSFKTALATAPVGTRLRATSVGGDFVLPDDPAVPLLLVAGGIGITPFAGQLAELRDSGAPRDVVLVWAVADAGDVAYRELLAASGARVVLVGRGVAGALPAGWSHVPGRLDTDVLRTAVPDAAERHGYVSGSPAFVADLRRALRAIGARRVRSDSFSGY